MKHAWLTRVLLVLLVTLLAFVHRTARPVAAATVTLYSVTDLGTLANGSTIANGLNNTGIVVGGSDILGSGPNGPFQYHAFRWHDGLMTDLGTLGGPQSFANSINASGLMGGGSDTTNPGGDAFFCFSIGLPTPTCPAQHAVLWDKGRLIDLGTLGGPNSGMFSGSVNNRGQAVGVAENATVDPTPFNCDGCPELRAFLWDKGAMADLGTLGGPDSLANGINDAGQVVGYSTFNTVIDPLFGGPDFHAFLWRQGSMTDLGTLGGPLSAANGINNQGQVVGNADTTIPDPTCGPSLTFPESHPALWQDGTVTDLTTFPGDTEGRATVTNDRGQVVGSSGNCQFVLRALLWQNGTVTDLNTVIPANSGWTLFEARGINARGQIIGYGLHNTPPPFTSLSPLRGFLLTLNRGEGEPAPARGTAELAAMVHTALATLSPTLQGLLRWPNRGLGYTPRR